MFWSP
jgi:hypothetical protein